jgi:hypothetical protein
MFYFVELKHKYYLSDRDYQDFVLFNLYRYTDTIDISFMGNGYYGISADFESLDEVRQCLAENDFIQNIVYQCDREMLTSRTYLCKNNAMPV